MRDEVREREPRSAIISVNLLLILLPVPVPVPTVVPVTSPPEATLLLLPALLKLSAALFMPPPTLPSNSSLVGSRILHLFSWWKRSRQSTLSIARARHWCDTVEAVRSDWKGR